MKVVILAGGFGTRILEESQYIWDDGDKLDAAW